MDDAAHDKKLQKYDTDTDLMRIFSALGVITIHVSGISTFSGIFMNSVSRFSVPVFVIISGYYMLARKRNIKTLALKCVRLFAMMLLWAGIYYAYDLVHGARTFTGVRSLLKYLLTAEPVHLWYMYATITLYLFTPLLYAFAEHASRNEYRYVLGLTFLFGSPAVMLVRSGRVPALETILGKLEIPPYLLGMVFMYLLGGYLQRYGMDRPKLRYVLYMLGIAGAAVTVVSVAWPKDAENQTLLQSFFAPNVIIEGAMVFVFCKYFLRRYPVKSPRLRSAAHFIAQGTLGIYLAHPLVVRLIRSVPMPASTGISIILKTLLVFAVSAAVVSIVRMIPGLKHIVL